MFFRMTAVITLTGGTILLMWIGEQITSRGVGNGISLIIFAGIVARFPADYRPGVWKSARTGVDRTADAHRLRRLRRRAGQRSSSSWNAPSGGCWCSIPSARSATACSAANPRICR